MIPWLPALLACTPAPGDGPGCDPDPPPSAVVATVADDYATGALVQVPLEGREPGPPLAPTSGDPRVVTREGRVWLLEREAAPSVRAYAPGCYTAPELEIPVGTNPQDLEPCGEHLFVSLYGEDHLEVRDPDDGALAGTVDLSAFDDGDGLPEAAGMVVLGDRLYAGLHQFDRDHDWAPAGGVVVEVDCATLEVTASWEVGASPDPLPHPLDPERLVVRTGAWFAADGGLVVLDPVAGTWETAVDEADLGEEVVGLGAVGSGHGLLLTAISEDPWTYGIHCIDAATWEHREAARLSSALWGAHPAPDGTVWVAARTSWAAPDSPGGLSVWDPEACLELTGGWIDPGLQPYDVAFTE